MKALFRPRFQFIGAALLFILVLSACGTPPAGESWAGISTDGRYLYVASKENIFRIDPVPPVGSQPTERHIEWLAKAPGNAHMYGPPAIGDDKVLYEGAYDKNFYAFAQNVSQSTAVPFGNGTPAPDRYMGGALVSGDAVYVGLGKDGLRAYNRANGSELWSFANTDNEAGVWSTPVIADGVLYFGSLDHNIYALDPHSGKMLWKVDLGGAIAGAPLIDSGILYIGTFTDDFVAVSINQQKILNKYHTDGWVWAGPVLKDNILYFGDLSGKVYALNRETWQLVWSTSDTDHPGAIRGRLALATVQGKDMVLAGSESKYIRAYDAKTGAVFWTSGISANDQILSDLIVLGDDVIATTLSDTQIVVAFNLETGQKSWSVNLTDELTRLQTATSIPIPSNVSTLPPAIGTAAPDNATAAPATPVATAAPTSAM